MTGMTTHPDTSARQYFESIEEAFCRQTGKIELLSPMDWALIEEWFQRRIPLKVVYRGMAKAFDACPPKKRIRSLMYCHEAVETELLAWRESEGAQES